MILFYQLAWNGVTQFLFFIELGFKTDQSYNCDWGRVVRNAFWLDNLDAELVPDLGQPLKMNSNAAFERYLKDRIVQLLHVIGDLVGFYLNFEGFLPCCSYVRQLYTHDYHSKGVTQTLAPQTSGICIQICCHERIQQHLCNLNVIERLQASQPHVG